MAISFQFQENRNMKPLFIPQTYHLRVIVLLLLIAIGLVVYRATTIGFAHDEALTYLYFVRMPFETILVRSGAITSMVANNHVFHSLAVKQFYMLFGFDAFILRIPAIAGFVIYTVGSLATIRLIRKGRAQVFLLAPLLFSPYILDISSAARGYSIALAGTIWTIYAVVSCYKHQKLSIKNVCLAAIASMIATTSILSFVHVFIAGAILLGLLFLSKVKDAIAKQQVHKEILFIFLSLLGAYGLASVVLYATYGHFVFKAAAMGYFYIGGTNGFFTDTVTSLFSMALYGTKVPYLLIWMWKRFVLAALVGLVGYTLLLSLYKDKWKNMLIPLLGFWIFPMFSIIGMRRFAGVLYITERSALFFIPISFLLVGAFVSSLSKSHKTLRFLSVAIYAFFGVYAIIGILTVKKDRFLLWDYDKNTQAAIQSIPKKTYQRGYMTWIFEPAGNYYRLHEQRFDFPVFERELPQYCKQLDFFYGYDPMVTAKELFLQYGVRPNKQWSDTQSTLYLR